ncbi:hypothetical protein ACWGK1_01615 [Streptomyces wedmorensis]
MTRFERSKRSPQLDADPRMRGHAVPPAQLRIAGAITPRVDPTRVIRDQADEWAFTSSAAALPPETVHVHPFD